ncbi:hypothetical protein BEH70_23780 [Citrobacter freundii]|uniref:ead/Ea22-like family protein n=1 Tax=Citrobacter TaxID=544 RepID=UPI00091EB388|nr:ead/Ea22-like family protein [Citrobacter sp. Cf101]MDM3189125.1 ead/Ea22-like family protein [Citrobacter sp. Cf101]OIZ35865.1 hypothetical protein BEH70_23780 [Citrobacter freundii]
MTVYEMEGFLRGNGIPGDLKANESNAQYLVRKFSELQSQNARLAVQLANADSKCRELAALREKIESAADAYWQFDNGWISDMKCGDLSHEYLLFVKEPKNVLALLDELEAAEKRIAELTESHSKLRDTMAGIHNTIRMDGGYTPLAAILNAAKRAYEESATAAGIGVKGE